MDRRAVLLAGLGACLLRAGAVHAAAHIGAAPTFEVVWEAFKAAHVRSGQVTDSFSGIAHSEGQGYAMLFSTWAGDRATFNQVWAFTRKMQRPDGLFSWRWEGGKVTDPNNATDGDIYIAWALLEAAKRFGDTALKSEALRVLDAMKALRAPSKHGVVLLPGAVGFLDPATAIPRVNLSYWVFPAFDAFKQVHDPQFWGQLTDTGLRIMGYSYYGRFQLPADWVVLGDPVAAYGQPPRFGYDAIRVPLFLAWSKKLDHPVLSRFKLFTKNAEFPAAVVLNDDGAKLEKAPSFALVAQVVERVGKEKSIAAGTAIPPDYYGKALMLLSMRALTS